MLNVRTCIVLLAAAAGCPFVNAEVRDRAVLSLRFDETAQPVADSAKTGKIADQVTATGGASVIGSAFIPGAAGHSMLLDPQQKQQLLVAHSEDVSRPEAVTISGLFASLHPLSDATYHGLFAKRRPGAGDVSNYGINFNPSTDTFQLYVNDGNGYKVGVFSVKSAIGFRRRVHISATFLKADAPGADADGDVDDVRIQLFVNGAAQTPTAVNAGFAEGTSAWLTDIALEKCVNDTPLTIGSSFTDGELTKVLVDEFHVFAEALSDADAAALFAEIAGAAAPTITAEQNGGPAPVTMSPQIDQMRFQAAEIGKTTRIMVVGNRLTGAELRVDSAGVKARAVETQSDQSVSFDVTVDADVVPGRYLARCVTPNGVSNAAVMTIDRIPVVADGTLTEAAPATALPVSVAGQISGTEQKRVWFRGTAGQKVAAEVEARRIGSRLDPVVEIRSQSGTPLAIQWQQPDLKGDARTSVVLPADGLYYAEVHDLQYQAAGGSAWRLILGDLPPSSLSLPSAANDAELAVRTTSRDGISEPVSIRKTNGRLAVTSGTPVLALPPLPSENGVIITEPIDGAFPADPVDATFVTPPFPALTVTGRILAAKETDALNIKVTPGQTLYFSVQARAMGSSLRAHLAVLNGEAVLAQNDGESGANDPAVSLAVPEGVTQLQVRVRDVNQKGSPDSVYRLQIARSDRQAFVLTTRDESLRPPMNGSSPLRLSVVRQSPSFRYTGPIHLTLRNAFGLKISPSVIPASETNQELFVTISRTMIQIDESLGDDIVIEGKAEGAELPYTTTVRIEMDAQKSAALTLPGQTLVAGPAESIMAMVLLDGPPPVLFRGTQAILPVRVLALGGAVEPLVRFEMVTTETPRKEDPNRPDSPVKPQVTLEEFQFGEVREAAFPLRIQVPLDSPFPTLNAVVSAEFVDQPLALSTRPRSWSAPIQFSVENAAAPAIPAEPFRVRRNATTQVSIALNRHPFYSEALVLALDGLPAGVTAVAVTVPVDQKAATFDLMVAESVPAGELANVTLRLQTTSGRTLSPPIPVKLLVE